MQQRCKNGKKLSSIVSNVSMALTTWTIVYDEITQKFYLPASSKGPRRCGLFNDTLGNAVEKMNNEALRRTVVLKVRQEDSRGTKI